MAASMDYIFARRFIAFSGSFRPKMTLCAILFVLILKCGTVSSVDRPRGVSIEKMSLYNPNQPFTCFDGSLKMEFERVNDDYCDCPDGSDEPGTSACPNGFFTCRNKGHITKTIPSSRVNDGICDCCDGSDEHGKHELCENSCLELGRAAREAMEKQRQRLIEGNVVFLEYVSQGEKAKKDNKERLDMLLKDKEGLEKERTEMEEKKKAAEEPEKAAKHAHEQAWEEVKAKRDAEAEEAKAEAAFKDLDANNDGSVSYQELVTRTEFDTDGDGLVSDEEAKTALEGFDEMDIIVFKDKAWTNMKAVYRRPTTDEPPTTETTPTPDDVDADLAHDDKDDEDDDDYHESEEKALATENEQQDEDKMPEYNEDTKRLIETADLARSAYNEVDAKFRELEREIRDLEEMATIDFGPKDAFYPLKGQCFEFTDREYVYKLCPFDRASQRSKNGGGETNLGRWGSWTGGPDDLYGRMKYEGGQNCWNGPDRSLTVTLQCGATNQLTSVSEPNRCEYHADFFTPALCAHIPPPADADPLHDEL